MNLGSGKSPDDIDQEDPGPGPAHNNEVAVMKPRIRCSVTLLALFACASGLNALPQ